MPNPRAAGTTTEMIVRFTDKGDYWVYDIGANSILTAQDAAILPPGAPFPPTSWDFAGSFDAANSTAVGGAVEWNLSTTQVRVSPCSFENSHNGDEGHSASVPCYGVQC
jgi:hypothetical protein